MATKSGKVRSLYVRPIQSADLSLEVPGIISFQGKQAQLGERVVAFNLEEKIYPILDTKEPDANEQNSLFKYNAEAILKELDKDLLYTVISGSLRASLMQAILLRANAYLEKYNTAFIDEIQKFYNNVYNKDVAGEDTTVSKGADGKPLFQSSKDKISRLESLGTMSSSKHEALLAKYDSENKANVVTNNISTTISNDNDYSDTDVTILPTASQTLKYGVTVSSSAHTTDPVTTISGKTVNNEFKSFEANDQPNIKTETSKTTHHTNQKTNTDLVELKHPSKDASIDYERIQLDLQDELLKHQVMSKKVKNMTSIMNNELRLLELDIKKLQHTFLQTVLVSPISGIVTAIYKDKGETVSPGEPIIRIENDDELLIVGFIQYRGLLRAGISPKDPRVASDPILQGTKVILTTKLYETDEDTLIPGYISSIRGQDADDDEWDVIIHCENANKILPLNYHFDKDNTSITIDS